MKHFLLSALLLAAAVCTNAAMAQNHDFGQNRVIPIWDNSSAPHSNGLDGKEHFNDPYRLAGTADAELYVFDADPAKNTGLAIVVCPGGGYERLAMDHEGFMVARWLAENGIAAYILKYRMPNGHPEVPLEDAVEALKRVRKDSDYRKTGIMGFSAGGHLAAYASTFAANDEKPDFAVLFYPVISSEPDAIHKGSFDNLLGSGRTAEESAKYSLERCVTPDTPTTILLLSDDDAGVPPSGAAAYYAALKRNGVKASMHIFPEGGHGWGFRDWFAYHETCKELLLRWLSRQ